MFCVTRHRAWRHHASNLFGDAAAAPARWPCHQALATAIAYLVICGVTMPCPLVTAKVLEICRGVTMRHKPPCAFRFWVSASGGLEGWAARRPVAQRPRERKRPRPGTGIPVFRAREKCPSTVFFAFWKLACLRRSSHSCSKIRFCRTFR